MQLISGIELVEIVGKPIETDGITFVAAHFDFLEANEGQVENRFLDHTTAFGPLLDILISNDHEIDVMLPYWVRGRIPRLFHFNPSRRIEPTDEAMQDFPFLAIIRDESISPRIFVPFVCMEYGFDIGLAFVDSNNSQALKLCIADAFWKLLARDPTDTADYDEIVFTEDGSVRFYFMDNQLSSIALDPDNSAVGQVDTQYARVPDAGFRCPDCDGDGVEDLFPFTEDCATCGGTGAVQW